jgi:hypothetical protein
LKAILFSLARVSAIVLGRHSGMDKVEYLGVKEAAHFETVGPRRS